MGKKFITPNQEEIEWFEKEVREKIWFSKDSDYPHELLREIIKELKKIRKKK